MVELTEYEKTRAMFAAHALCGLLTNQISRAEIQAIADGKQSGCPFVEAALKLADAMMETM